MDLYGEIGPISAHYPETVIIYHCHLKKGRPTYVAVREVLDKEIKLIEVIYAGTYEKAPY